MKDAVFTSNNKLFAEVEAVKKQIRGQIRDKATNSAPSPTPNKKGASGHSKALHRTSR